MAVLSIGLQRARDCVRHAKCSSTRKNGQLKVNARRRPNAASKTRDFGMSRRQLVDQLQVHFAVYTGSHAVGSRPIVGRNRFIAPLRRRTANALGTSPPNWKSNPIREANLPARRKRRSTGRTDFTSARFHIRSLESAGGAASRF
jgi:hypothetical protein